MHLISCAQFGKLESHFTEVRNIHRIAEISRNKAVNIHTDKIFGDVF